MLIAFLCYLYLNQHFKLKIRFLIFQNFINRIVKEGKYEIHKNTVFSSKFLVQSVPEIVKKMIVQSLDFVLVQHQRPQFFQLRK